MRSGSDKACKRESGSPVQEHYYAPAGAVKRLDRPPPLPPRVTPSCCSQLNSGGKLVARLALMRHARRCSHLLHSHAEWRTRYRTPTGQ